MKKSKLLLAILLINTPFVFAGQANTAKDTVKVPQSALCKGKEIYISGNNVLWGKPSIEKPLVVYAGTQKPTGIIACGTGVVTTFRMSDSSPKDHAFYSPNCEYVGQVGPDNSTELVYNGSQTIVSLSQPANKKGIVARWRHASGREHSYTSLDCKHVGGGGKTNLK